MKENDEQGDIPLFVAIGDSEVDPGQEKPRFR